MNETNLVQTRVKPPCREDRPKYEEFPLSAEVRRRLTDAAVHAHLKPQTEPSQTSTEWDMFVQESFRATKLLDGLENKIKTREPKKLTQHTLGKYQLGDLKN